MLSMENRTSAKISSGGRRMKFSRYEAAQEAPPGKNWI
jgi:hypothetical protein